MRYELFYWPSIQGRGEFVRLALEEACADYVDAARQPGPDGGIAAMHRLMDGKVIDRPSFAPPFLRAGKLVIGQTANILQYLGPRLGLAPDSEAGRLWTHQIQLVITDFLVEAHDAHHPIANSLYYHEQKAEARRRTGHFIEERIPKYFGYFEGILAGNARGYMVGRSLTYADLSIFQIVAGMRYAFPRTMTKLASRFAGLMALHERVAKRPNVAAYLASERRIAFNENGIFRHYPELEE